MVFSSAGVYSSRQRLCSSSSTFPRKPVVPARKIVEGDSDDIVWRDVVGVFDDGNGRGNEWEGTE